jgi:glucosylceramidase
MKINTRGLVGAAAVLVLHACGGDNPAGSGSNSTSGGAPSGGFTGSGGAADGSGGTTSGTGGATEGAGGTTSGTGGATDVSDCISYGDTDAGTADGGLTVPIVMTSAEGCYWQQRQLTEVTTGDANVTVYDSSEAQTWDGFGGAFTELGWNYLSTLSQADQERAIQLLFGSDGARFAWGRIPIGGNDFVVSRHTLDDTGDDVIPDSTESNRPPPDLSLNKFSIAGNQQNLIPYVKAAQAVKPDIRFWAAPWTPPVWMKTGYSKTDSNGAAAKKPSYYDGGSIKSDDATLAAHAQYFVKFVQAYKEQGINVELVAPQNEPAGGHTYPSCAWDKVVHANFIGKFLGPALAGAGLSTRVMLGGSLDASSDTDFVNAVLADSTATGYCAVAGLGYNMVAASKVTALKSAGLPIWVSEHKAGNYWWQSDYQPIAPNDMAYGIETWGLIRDAITKVGVSAYNAWHMVLDKVGKNIDMSIPWAQDSLLVADSGQLIATPAYYVFRHFSRYVEPGAKVVGTTGGDAVAFKNPNGSVVVVLHNSGAAQTMTVSIGGQKLQFSVPGRGFATLVSP